MAAKLKRQTRETLIRYFQKGRFPTAVHFEHLINSMVNIIDDGLGKNEKDGLYVAPKGESDKLMSFFKSLERPEPEWQMTLRQEEAVEGLSFDRVIGDERRSSLFLSDQARVGVQTTNPQTELEVNGTIGYRSRIGTHRVGMVDGDGEWHPILTGLKGLCAFEIVAAIKGPPGRGKYGMTHAIAISTHGRSRNKIKQLKAHFGWFQNKIVLRWRGEVDNYTLEMRTRTHYGIDDELGLSKIKYHISSLWDEEAFDRLYERQKGEETE